jgi:hypothetical protein
MFFPHYSTSIFRGPKCCSWHHDSLHFIQPFRQQSVLPLEVLIFWSLRRTRIKETSREGTASSAAEPRRTSPDSSTMHPRSFPGFALRRRLTIPANMHIWTYASGAPIRAPSTTHSWLPYDFDQSTIYIPLTPAL